MNFVMYEKPKLILKREEPKPHYEIHFEDRVDFVTLDGESWGSSKIHAVN